MHINYTKFSNEELDDIKIEFDAFGYPVNDADDFCTYKGWLERGRRVKRGEKGLKTESSHIYSKPLFNYGQMDKRQADKSSIKEHREQSNKQKNYPKFR